MLRKLLLVLVAAVAGSALGVVFALARVAGGTPGDLDGLLGDLPLDLVIGGVAGALPGAALAARGVGPRWLVAIAGVALLAVAYSGFSAVSLFYLGPRRALRHEAAQARRVQPLLLADEALVAAQPLFQRAAGDDAGPLLNAWLPWEGEDDRAQRQHRLFLEPALVEKLGGKTWTSAAPSELGAHDFGWMRELRSCGHWDLAAKSPLSEKVERRELDWPTASLPYFTTLNAWVKLRLLDGVARGDLPGAVQDVELLARLTQTAGTVLGAAVASILIRLTHDAAGAVPQTQIRFEASAESGAALGRIGRLLFALPQPLMEPALARALLDPRALPVDRCLLLTESAVQLSSLRELLESNAPDFARDFAQAIDQGACPLATAIWHTPRETLFAETAKVWQMAPEHGFMMRRLEWILAGLSAGNDERWETAYPSK